MYVKNPLSILLFLFAVFRFKSVGAQSSVGPFRTHNGGTQDTLPAVGPSIERLHIAKLLMVHVSGLMWKYNGKKL